MYDYELFNMYGQLHRAEEKEIITVALRTGGERAQRFARSLAVRWDPEQSPLLNLELVLFLVEAGDNALYDELIGKSFRTIRNFNDGSSAEAFCNFIADKVLPKFKPAPNLPTHGLFRFLTLLLPVDSGPDLNSESDSTYRKLLSLYPAYGIGLLREALKIKPTRHRAHVWRLLASVPGRLKAKDPLIAEAQEEVVRATGADTVAGREAKRFLEHCAPAVKVTES